ncbi:MAG: hypothetical protein ACREHG_02825 [Candidatus Saccharimonadales bacterium]
MNKQTMFRQGDILLKKIDKIPSSAKETKNKVVAEGEGHHSHVVTQEVQVFVSDESMYLAVNKAGRLEHVVAGTTTPAEHKVIDLPAGNYQVVVQKEYDPFEKIIRQVQD